MKYKIYVIDMVKGFCEHGELADPGIKHNILKPIQNLIEAINPAKEDLIYFADTHTAQDAELEVFPPHCMAGTEESEVIAELQGYAHTLIPKTTTNGFLNLPRTEDLEDPDTVHIITGCCSDICVITFALSLKTWLNSKSGGRVIVPLNCIDTYNTPILHNREVYNHKAADLMRLQGIEVVETFSPDGEN